MVIIANVFSPSGGIGIRGRLRACALWAWRFESSLGQQNADTKSVGVFYLLSWKAAIENGRLPATFAANHPLTQPTAEIPKAAGLALYRPQAEARRPLFAD